MSPFPLLKQWHSWMSPFPLFCHLFPFLSETTGQAAQVIPRLRHYEPAQREIVLPNGSKIGRSVGQSPPKSRDIRRVGVSLRCQQFYDKCLACHGRDMGYSRLTYLLKWIYACFPYLRTGNNRKSETFRDILRHDSWKSLRNIGLEMRLGVGFGGKCETCETRRCWLLVSGAGHLQPALDGPGQGAEVFGGQGDGFPTDRAAAHMVAVLGQLDPHEPIPAALVEVHAGLGV